MKREVSVCSVPSASDSSCFASGNSGIHAEYIRGSGYIHPRGGFARRRRTAAFDLAARDNYVDRSVFMSRRENCRLSFSAAAEENSSSNIEYADDRAGRARSAGASSKHLFPRCWPIRYRFVASRKNATSTARYTESRFSTGFAALRAAHRRKSIVGIMHPRPIRSSNSKAACQPGQQ